MLFKNETVLLYLTSGTIRLYSNKKGFIGLLKLEPKDFNFLDIQDQASFENSVRYFLEKHAIRKLEVNILLSDDIVFSKSFTSLGTTNEDDYVNEFLDTIPLDRAKVTCVVYNGKDSNLILATNPTPYLKIKEILESYLCKVPYIGVAQLLDPAGRLKEDKADITSVKDMLSLKKDLENVNFFKSVYRPGRSKLKTRLLVLFSVAVIGLLLLGIYLLFNLLRTPKSIQQTYSQKVVLTQESTMTATQESSPSTVSESEFLDKTKIRINVVNGTKIAGEATKIKNALLDEGFVIIDTANADTLFTKSTTLEYSPNISPSEKEIIMKALEESFESVTESTMANTGEFDVIVTTGLGNK